MTLKSTTYSGWGNALVATGDLARPERQSALCALPSAPAIGNRRSYGDACLNDGGTAVDMTRLNRILAFDHATGLLTAEAGVTLGDVLAVTIPHGWLPAVLPGTGFATVGGAIAMDVHGKNHHTVGSFGQHITRLTLLQNGKAQDVPAGTSLFRATVGGLGQTGIITQATLQLIATDGAAMDVQEARMANLDEQIAMLEASTSPYAVSWIDATAKGDALGRGILEEARITRAASPVLSRAKSVPRAAPQWLLSPLVVRAFNARYFARIPEAGRKSVKALESFFFPLDRIHNWNRLYGKRGFHQFQCVLPMDQTETLRRMLEAISDSGLASPLAVLKRMGEGRAGMMSFPMEGFTLAVDFPNRTKAIDVIARLENMARDAGGRIYLAKDALSDGKTIRAMYPEHADWARVAAKADPDGALETDLTRRLSLRSL